MFAPLRKSDPEWYEFDWRQRIVQPWGRSRLVALGQIARPIVSNGFYLECTQAGLTAQREPPLPAVASSTVNDGSAVWTLRAPSAITVPVVSTCVYTVTPATVTQASTSIIAALAVTRVRLDAASANVGRYLIAALMTDNLGEQYSASEEFDVID